jgi:hypothetical protein
MLLKQFLQERNLLTDELGVAIDEYYKNMRNNNNKTLCFPWGKYKGIEIEKIKQTDRKYCDYLLNKTTIFIAM